jgi:hypothetical protein
MAQYGKNFYGASYYGRRGTFGGQYTSEEINSGNPLAGSLTNTTVVILPTSLYISTDPIFSYSNQSELFSYSGNNYSKISNATTVNINMTCSDFSIGYLKNLDGGIIKLSVQTYVDGVQVNDYNTTINTSGATVHTLFTTPQLPFGEQFITISHDTGSTGYLYIHSINARTTDVAIEARSKTGSGEFSNWESLTMTRTITPGVFNGFSLVGDTSDYTGRDCYQFRILLGSADDSTTPLVKSCSFRAGSSSNYSDNGQLRVRIDLGTDVSTINNLTYTAQVPEGTDVKIQTRTASAEPFTSTSWTSWSAPYSSSVRRIRLKSYNLLQANNPISEYIITPVINPENEAAFVSLMAWIEFTTAQYITDQNTSIRYQILDETMNRMTYIDNSYAGNSGIERYIEFLATDSNTSTFDLSRVGNRPMRVKMIISRTQGALSSPVIDFVNYRANARYREIKEFSQDGLYKAYVSPVYGNNTGIIDLTYNDSTIVGDGTLATPYNLGFTIPTPIGGTGAISPSYSIETDSNTFGIYRAGEELNLYWKSQTGLINKSISTTNSSDVIVAQAKAWPDNSLSKAEAKLFKYYQYGRGYFIYPDVVEVPMTNIFLPPLDVSSGMKYSYYFMNSWDGKNDINTNIHMEWASNNASNISEISEANGSIVGGKLHNDSILISAIIANANGEVPWVSDEKIFDVVVNSDNKYMEKVITIQGSDIPEIDSGVSIGDNPYSIDIVYRSVECNGKIVPEERVKVPLRDENGDVVLDLGKIVYEYPKAYLGDDSLEPVTKYRVAVVRNPSSSNDYLDPLPDTRVTAVHGIYFDSIGANPDSPEAAPASFYTEGYDFQVVGNYIDWSIAYDNGVLKAGRQVPTDDSSYYVTYTYNAMKKLYIAFRCEYNEFETTKELWTSDIVKEYTGSCSPGYDFKSEQLPSKTSITDWGPIPANVDNDTLFYVLNDDNMWVSTFLDDNVVVGTLRNRIPSQQWLPKIHNGYYYIGKDEYYLYTEPKTYIPTRDEVETAVNAQYATGKYGNGIFIEEGTTNIVLNSGFDKVSDNVVIFSDSFVRTV